MAEVARGRAGAVTVVSALVALALALAALAVALTRAPAAPAPSAQATVSCRDDGGDSARLQQALDGSAPGSAVTVAGPCLLTRTLVLPDDRTLRGAARGSEGRRPAGTTLVQAPGADLPALIASASWMRDSRSVSSDERIEHLTLVGDAARNHGTAGIVLRSWRSRVDDVEVADMPGDGIRISSPSRHGTALSSTMVNSSITDSFVHDVGGSDVHVVDPGNAATDWTLQGNWLSGARHGAVELDNAAGWQIRGNHLYGLTGDGIGASRCFGTTISDNEVEDFGGVAGRTSYGISCTAQPGIPSTIEGNRVAHPARPAPSGPLVYLGVTGEAPGSASVVIEGNALAGTGTTGGQPETGIALDGGPAQLTAVSSGNLVTGMTQDRSVTGSVSLSGGQ